MKTIGITGGIGAGKSTVLNILSEKGFYIINSDIIAKEVVAIGQPAYLNIIKKFGIKILKSNDEIDRKRLSDIVFKDMNLLKELNNIVHPKVIDRIKEIISNVSKNKEFEGVAIEAVVPIEEFRMLCDEIWVIKASNENVISRVLKRDNVEPKDVIERIDSQKEIDYDKLGDRIILNNGNLEDLKQQLL